MIKTLIKQEHIRAVYARENKPWIRQSAAYLSRELSHLYEHVLYKKLVHGLRKPRTSFLCHLYEHFAAYISRGLCNPRLIFPRIDGPIVAATLSCNVACRWQNVTTLLHATQTKTFSADFKKHFFCPGHKIFVHHKCCTCGKTSQHLGNMIMSAMLPPQCVLVLLATKGQYPAKTASYFLISSWLLSSHFATTAKNEASNTENAIEYTCKLSFSQLPLKTKQNYFQQKNNMASLPIKVKQIFLSTILVLS